MVPTTVLVAISITETLLELAFVTKANGAADAGIAHSMIAKASAVPVTRR
jgi:hypothetical protein